MRQVLLFAAIFFLGLPAAAQVPPQFDSLKSCIALPTSPPFGTKTQSKGTDCAPRVTPGAPLPPVWDGTHGAYVDPDFGTRIYRLTPQKPMLPNCGYRTFNAPHQMWNADDTLMMVAQYDASGPCYTDGSGLWLFCGKNDGTNACGFAGGAGRGPARFQLIKEIPKRVFAGNGSDEAIIAWDPKDRCVFWYLRYHHPDNVLYKADACSDRLTEWSTISRLTDTQGHTLNLATGLGYSLQQRTYCNISDNGRLGFIALEAAAPYRFVGFGVLDTNRPKKSDPVLWFHNITAQGDIPLQPYAVNKQPASACVDQSGSYLTTPWNVSHSWRVVSGTRDSQGTVKVQVATGTGDVFAGSTLTEGVSASGKQSVAVAATLGLLSSGTPQAVIIDRGAEAEELVLGPGSVAGSKITSTFAKPHSQGTPVRLKVWLIGTLCNGSKSCYGVSGGFDGEYSIVSVHNGVLTLQPLSAARVGMPCADHNACQVTAGAVSDHNRTGNEQWSADNGAYIGRVGNSNQRYLSLDNGIHQDTIYLEGGATTALATMLCLTDEGLNYDYVRFNAFSLDPARTVGCTGQAGTTDTQLLDSVRTGANTSGWSVRGEWHVSGRGSAGAPGWELVSTYRHDSVPDTTPQTLLQSEIFAIHLDNSNEVRRIAHDFACTNASGNGRHSYFAEPHATWNHRGDMIAFTSTWGNCKVADERALGDSLNLFVVDLSKPETPKR